jgi:Fe-S oxidoreductase
MKRSRERGFCCGGGGACIRMEHEAGQRANDVRMDEIQAIGPALAAVACPFCMIMLGEVATRRELDGTMVLKDIAEVIADAL